MPPNFQYYLYLISSISHHKKFLLSLNHKKDQHANWFSTPLTKTSKRVNQEKCAMYPVQKREKINEFFFFHQATQLFNLCIKLLRKCIQRFKKAQSDEINKRRNDYKTILFAQQRKIISPANNSNKQQSPILLYQQCIQLCITN